jgi:hypothetical protein
MRFLIESVLTKAKTTPAAHSISAKAPLMKTLI